MSHENKEEKRNNHMMKISFVSVLLALLCLIEMYEIINDPTNLIAIGALGVFILVAVYADIFFIGKMNEAKAKVQEEAFDDVYRSEKASYLLIRKYFDQMDRKMDSFGDRAVLPYKELVSAQKALAKVQINRSKQNANALLISNDKMLHKISSFQKEIADLATNTNNVGLTEQDKEIFTEGNKDILVKQQEILAELKELESSLRNEIIESANKLASMKSQQTVTPELQMPVQENLQPLDMDMDFSLDSDQTSNQILENSSESELDKLLKGMDSDLSNEVAQERNIVSEEPELEPLMTEPELGSLNFNEEPELGSLDSDEGLELEPMMEAEPELGSLDSNEGLELEPVMEAEPELGSLDSNEIPELESIMKEASELDSLEIPEVESIQTESDSMELPELDSMEQLEPELGSLEDLNAMQESKIAESELTEPELNAVQIPELNEMSIESETNSDGDSDLQTILAEPELGSLEAPELNVMSNRRQASSLRESELDAMLAETEASIRKESAIEPKSNSIMAQKTISQPQEHIEAEKADRKLPDLSDPNHEVTPDELAAMVANLGSDIVVEPEPETEKVTEKSKSMLPETTAEEPIAAKSEDSELDQIMKAMDLDDIIEEPLEDLDIDKILEVPLSKSDSSNSNQFMSSEEIASLIANTNLLSEPAPSKNQDLPDLSDPGYVMSSDEIAALIANM